MLFGRITRVAAAVSAPLALAFTVLAPAHAAAPKSKTVKWTDPANDQATLVLAGLDPTVDILASQITGSQASLDAVTTMAQVSTQPPLTGDGVIVETFFTVADHTFYMVAERSISGDRFTLEYLDPTTTPKSYVALKCADCTGKFDTTNNTVSFHAPLATVNAAIAVQKVAPIGKKAKLTALETDSLIYRGIPGVRGLVSVADTSMPTNPNTALVIP